MYKMVIVKYFTCDKSTNRCRMVIVNYLTCDKSTNVYRMVTVNYFTCEISKICQKGRQIAVEG